MTFGPDGNPELERQRVEVEAVFREQWAPLGGGPRVLTERVCAEARKIIDHPGRTWLDEAVLQAVRDGAQPGDALPPLQPNPFIRNVTDAEVILSGSGTARRVAVLFCHDHFPGVRFGHRFPLDPFAEDHESIWLMEEIETGALHRIMRNQPPADRAGIIWTTWGSPAR